MRRLRFLVAWLALTFALSWFPPLNAAVYGEPPTLYAPYPGPYTPVRVGTPLVPRGSALPVTEPTSDPLAGASVRGHSVTGVPTYYCRAGVSRCTHGYPDGPGVDLYAAAGPSLRVGDWRGRIVTVCARVCLRVELVDFCQCPAPHFLDLYYDSWLALGRPSRAVVSW